MHSSPMFSQCEQVGRRPSHLDFRRRHVSQASSVLLRFGRLVRSDPSSGDMVHVLFVQDHVGCHE